MEDDKKKEEQAKEEQRMERQAKAVIAFNELLREFNCYPEVSVTICTDGSLKGQVQIIARK